jgi:hypothetical protein
MDSSQKEISFDLIAKILPFTSYSTKSITFLKEVSVAGHKITLYFFEPDKTKLTGAHWWLGMTTYEFIHYCKLWANSIEVELCSTINTCVHKYNNNLKYYKSDSEFKAVLKACEEELGSLKKG